MDMTQETAPETKEVNKNLSEAMKGNQNAKKKPFTEQMKRFIMANPQKMEKIIEGLFKEAEEGSIPALNMIMDRVEGKPIQATEITGADGAEFAKGIGFVFVDSNAKPD
jgi:glucosamine 6-phosphate synthetase-like amidotransferase/phosphosugar isomerase protein